MTGRPPTGAELAAWQRAQALWGVTMHTATMTPGEGRKRGAPAWFTFPPAICVDPHLVASLGASAELDSVFAHELGHHVLAPATRLDSLKIRHQMGRALVAVGEEHVDPDDIGMLSNLWTDLLVNARVAALQRTAAGPGTDPGIVRLYRLLFRSGTEHGDRLWWVYQRTYEIVWLLPAATFCPADPPPPPPASVLDRFPVSDDYSRVDERFLEQEHALRAARKAAAEAEAALALATVTRPQADAMLVADTVRTFAADPVAGAARFGVIAAPYIAERHRAGPAAASGTRRRRWGGAAAGAGIPTGACSADDAPPTAAELGKILADRRLRGALPAHPGVARKPGDAASSTEAGSGQSLGAAETAALYPPDLADAVLTAWYRAEASPWVRPLTRSDAATDPEELPGPLEAWEIGDDLADLDWAASLQAGPLIPGVTTRRRSRLADTAEHREAGLDVDLYLDSSGSMPSPRSGSPAVLAATVLALSVLRGHGRMRVTSFSGPGQVAGHDRFTRDIRGVIAGVMEYFGGGTSFPLDVYWERYRRLPDDRATPGPGAGDEVRRRHVVVLSDDGLTSMFGTGNEELAFVAAAVRPKLATATLLLMDPHHRVADAAAGAHYDVVYLSSMSDAPAACARLARILHD